MLVERIGRREIRGFRNAVEDRTLQYMCSCQQLFPGFCKTLRFPETLIEYPRVEAAQHLHIVDSVSFFRDTKILFSAPSTQRCR
jgi:hypothetical protein